VPTRPLPSAPNIEQLRNLAKTLQHLVREGDRGSVDFVREFHPRFATAVAGSPELTELTRADTQLALARSRVRLVRSPNDPRCASAPAGVGPLR
jgi:hypothetical protein